MARIGALGFLSFISICVANYCIFLLYLVFLKHDFFLDKLKGLRRLGSNQAAFCKSAANKQQHNIEKV